jgi:two-component system chemotaxis response regulator CheB
MEKNVLKPTCEMLMIGGSAGSLDVLLEIFPKIRTTLSFPVVVILHRKNTSDMTLTELLTSRTKMLVKEIEDKETILNAVVYVAPPDYHVLIEKTRQFAFDYSEKVNYSRPSIDVSFESASEVYGQSLVCIILSGANNDGTEGAKIVKRKGGIVVAQQPETAIVPFMPEFVIRDASPQHVLNPQELIQFINQL